MFVDDKPQGEITEAPAKTLKLSEALRSSMEPLCRDLPYVNDGACAAMQIYERLTGATRGEYGHDKVKTLFATTTGDPWMLGHVQSHNDIDKWSREQIADWLEAQGF